MFMLFFQIPISNQTNSTSVLGFFPPISGCFFTSVVMLSLKNNFSVVNKCLIFCPCKTWEQRRMERNYDQGTALVPCLKSLDF